MIKTMLNRTNLRLNLYLLKGTTFYSNVGAYSDVIAEASNDHSTFPKIFGEDMSL